jgi:hypothetical protein
MGEIKEDFETEYWKYREKNRKSIRTWEGSYRDMFKKIPDDDLFTEENAVKWIGTTKPDSRPRQNLIRVIKAIAEHLDVKQDINWKKFPCKYKPKQRFLPSDSYIESIWLEMIDEPAIAWSFGIIATYGIRPSELFQLTDVEIEQFLSPSNNRHVLYINEDTKTGSRIVYPLHSRWVDEFRLKEVRQLKTNFKLLQHKVAWLNKVFHRYGYKQGVYDLRHRYAIRATELNIAVDIAAKWMGHSLEEHTKTYQKWMDRTTHNKAFDAVLKVEDEENAVDALRLENKILKSKLKIMDNENKKLLLEVQLLKDKLMLEETIKG